VLEQVREARQPQPAQHNVTGERFQINPATCQVESRFFQQLCVAVAYRRTFLITLL